MFRRRVKDDYLVNLHRHKFIGHFKHRTRYIGLTALKHLSYIEAKIRNSGNPEEGNCLKISVRQFLETTNGTSNDQVE